MGTFVACAVLFYGIVALFGEGETQPPQTVMFSNPRCLECICKVESGCKPLGCNWDVNSYSCGYYQIKQDYYTDCYSPGRSWQTCAKNKACASGCVRSYMRRYARYCTGFSPSQLTCEAAARMHNGGPTGCKKSSTLRYWNRVNSCLTSSG